MTGVQTVVVLNGPNLNLLGTREPALYGSDSLADVEALCRQEVEGAGLQLEFRQTNHEGVLIDWIHEAGRRHAADDVMGVVLNAAAWTHTSVAVRDAIVGAQVPVVECHITNVHAREAFRHHSYVSGVAVGVVVGFGIQSYRLAIRGLLGVG